MRNKVARKTTTIVVTTALVVVIYGLAMLWLVPRADSAEPYGGCKEAVQVLDHGIGTQSEGVRYCRAHGWYIRPRIVIAPNGHAWTTLRRCNSEEAMNASCYWDAMHTGNGHGYGFVALPGRSIYVDYVNGRQVTQRKYLGHQWVIVPWRG